MRKRIRRTGGYLKDNLFTNISAGQTVIKNSFWLLLAEGTNKGALFLVTVLIARSFAPEEYGVFGYVFSVMMLIAMIADFGLADITIRELAGNRDRSREYFESMISLKLLLTCVAFACMSSAAFFLGPDIRVPAMLAGTAILLEGMTDYLRVSFRMAEHAQYEVVVKAATAILLIVLVAGCIALGPTLTNVLVCFCIAHLLGLLLLLRLLGRRISVSVRPDYFARIFRESWPMFLGLVCTTTYGQIDLILIRAYRGFAEVGLYQAAYKLIIGLQLLKVVHMAMFPRLAAWYAEGNMPEYRNLVRRSITLSLMVLVPVGLLIMAYPAEIIGAVFGQRYISASPALPLLIWSGIISFIAGYFTYTLIIAGRQKLLLALEAVPLVVLVVIEVVLIPRVGFYGAAVATLTGEALYLVIIGAYVYSNRKLRVTLF